MGKSQVWHLCGWLFLGRWTNVWSLPRRCHCQTNKMIPCKCSLVKQWTYGGYLEEFHWKPTLAQVRTHASCIPGVPCIACRQLEWWHGWRVPFLVIADITLGRGLAKSCNFGGLSSSSRSECFSLKEMAVPHTHRLYGPGLYTMENNSTCFRSLWAPKAALKVSAHVTAIIVSMISL